MQEAPDNPFFSGLSAEQLALILPLFETFTIPAGTTIFKQGDVATYLFVIQRGGITIQYKPYDGPMITLSHLRSGEVFGWSSVLGAHTYTSDAISTAESDVLRLRGSDLVQLCKEHPKAGYAILDRLAEVVSPRWTYARLQIQSVLEAHNPQLPAHAPAR